MGKLTINPVLDLHNKYKDMVLINPYRFGSIDADVTAFCNIAGITDATIISALDTMVKALKANSLWTIFKALYPFVGGTATTHKFNLKDARDLDDAYRLAFAGTITHNSNGITPNGTTGYANTFLVPSTALTLNNVALHYYCGNNSATATAEMSVIQSTNYINLHVRYSDGTMYSDMHNASGGRVSSTNSSSLGYHLANRVSSAKHNIWSRGTKLNENTTSGGSLPNIAIYINARNAGGVAGNFSAKNCRLAGISSSVTDAEAGTLYTIFQAFETALGRNV